MCLMLYIGTVRELPESSAPDLRIEAVEEHRRSVIRWFSQPSVRFVGAHTGCSCGFPSVIAEVPIEYYEGMPLDGADRVADLRSIGALLTLLAGDQVGGDTVELLPVWDGAEGQAPKGVIEWRLDDLDPDRLFFNEQFMHVVRRPVRRTAGAPGGRAHRATLRFLMSRSHAT